MSFATEIQKMFLGSIFSTEQLAESATYLPAAGGSVAVKIVVNRRPMLPKDYDGRLVASKIVQILVPNEETSGRIAITPRMDKIQFKWDLDDAANTTFVVTKIVSQNIGSWLLEVQA